ncbi:hypothetical protein JCM10207_003854 [Rhodosporidiobolus poonsookiae]
MATTPSSSAVDGSSGTSPHPHHLAEQLPPIQFESAPSENTMADDSSQPTAEKGSSHAGDGELSAGDVEKGQAAAPAPAQHDFPDGGLRAWSVVAGAWCISFTSWGFTNAFGVFQTYYQDNQLAEYTHSDISWIGSLELCLVLSSAILAGKAFDAGGIKYLLCASLCIYTAGMFGFASATKYYQIILGQGFACGLASGIAFIPAASSVSHWFKYKRATALGFLATGSSFGGIIYPAMLNHLFPRIGFKNTVRAAAGLTIGLVAIAALTVNSRLPPRKVKMHQIFDFSPLKEKAFLLFVLGETIIMLGLYMPYFYIQDYALANNVPKNVVDYSLSILNAASIFGRVIPNWLADTYGPLTILTPQCVLSGILIFIFLPACKTLAGLIVFCILFGFSSGAYVSMMPASVASQTKDMTQVGHRTAVMFLVISVAGLTGTPITGAIITSQNGSYVGACVFAGVCVLVGSCFVAASWWVNSRQRGTYWV